MAPTNPKSNEPIDPLKAASIKPLDDGDNDEPSKSAHGREPGPNEDDEDDDDGRLGGLPDAVRERLEALIPELVKKTFAAGIGAVSSTEDGIRRVTREMKLPKDMAGYLMDTAGNTKDEFMRILAREVREFLQTVNLSEEIAKMLTLLSFEVKTEIRFIPNDEKFTGVVPDVKASVKLKRAGKDDDGQDQESTSDSNTSNDSSKDDDDDGDDKPRRRLRRRSRG